MRDIKLEATRCFNLLLGSTCRDEAFGIEATLGENARKCRENILEQQLKRGITGCATVTDAGIDEEERYLPLRYAADEERPNLAFRQNHGTRLDG